MRNHAPFQPSDLEDLDKLLDQATAVVSMQEVYEGATDPRIIGLRHDVDNIIEPAVHMAHWEYARGYRSTYYILHTAPYWEDKKLLSESLDAIAACGHEIGVHNNAIAEAHRTEDDPAVILADAIMELLRLGHDVRGTVAHGDPDCYIGGQVAFVNDMLFTQCDRPEYFNPVKPVPLEQFGLDYDANWLPRGSYISDSGGTWSRPFDQLKFPAEGQLHMLVHPDWWPEAFTSQVVAA